MRPSSNRLYVLLALLPLTVCGPVSAQSRGASVEQLLQSVVMVKTFDAGGQGVALGSGVVVSRDGDILTNYHVIKGAAKVEIWTQKANEPSVGLVKRCDEESDLALIWAPSLKGARPVSIRSGRLPVGTRLLAIGSPLGLEGTVTDGILSAYRMMPTHVLVQTTAPISPGSSGGGLFSEAGQLVGIMTFFLSQAQNLNFAVVPPAPLSRLPECTLREPSVKQGDLVGPGPGVIEPRLLRLGPYRLPPEARKLALEGGTSEQGLGTPIIMALVTETGEIAEARVLRPSAYQFVDEAAIQALKAGTLEPATKDGVRVRMWKAWPIAVRP